MGRRPTAVLPGAAFELADAQSQAGVSGRARPRWGPPAQGSVGREERRPACAGLGEARDACGSPGDAPHSRNMGEPLPKLQHLLSLLFLLTSLFVLVEHLAVILTFWGSSSLHRPMYYFLGIMSSLEIWYMSDIIPKTLDGFLTQRGRVSFIGCMTQLYFFSFLVCTKCVLACMACDCCQAIMTMGLCIQLVAFSFVSGFTTSVIKVYSISSATFCGFNVLKHIFCDIFPILKLACTDFSTTELVDFVLAFIILVFPLVATMLSYGHIPLAALRIPSATGRRAFSTCASYLTVVTIFYMALIFMYVWPQAIDSRSSNNLISAVYTVLTPIINPLIYCLRNKEFKDALKKALDLGQLSQ
ncbi:LOW QUALITY PROTEIN: olfactory receptor 6B2-like [Megaptera novaeangliae]